MEPSRSTSWLGCGAFSFVLLIRRKGLGIRAVCSSQQQQQQQKITATTATSHNNHNKNNKTTHNNNHSKNNNSSSSININNSPDEACPQCVPGTQTAPESPAQSQTTSPATCAATPLGDLHIRLLYNRENLKLARVTVTFKTHHQISSACHPVLRTA